MVIFKPTFLYIIFSLVILSIYSTTTLGICIGLLSFVTSAIVSTYDITILLVKLNKIYVTVNSTSDIIYSFPKSTSFNYFSLLSILFLSFFILFASFYLFNSLDNKSITSMNFVFLHIRELLSCCDICNFSTRS